MKNPFDDEEDVKKYLSFDFWCHLEVGYWYFVYFLSSFCSLSFVLIKGFVLRIDFIWLHYLT